MATDTPQAQPLTAHTAGPWSSREDDDGVLVVTGGGRDICDVWLDREGSARPFEDRRRERHANARLIRSAPTMLAALIRQRDNIERWLATGEPAGAEESRAIYEQIAAAVAEATGDAP